MGLLSGAHAYRRFRVLGELPADFRDRFLEKIEGFTLRENDRIRSKEDNVGWVSIMDSGDTNLFLNKFLYNNILVLAMRIDKKRVPSKYLKIRTDRQVRETMQAQGLERIGASHKKQIREAIEEELLGRSLPVVATYDMAWDLEKMEVWLFATSDAVSDTFTALFHETFDMELESIRLSHWLQPGMSSEEIAARADTLVQEIWTA